MKYSHGWYTYEKLLLSSFFFFWTVNNLKILKGGTEVLKWHVSKVDLWMALSLKGNAAFRWILATWKYLCWQQIKLHFLLNWNESRMLKIKWFFKSRFIFFNYGAFIGTRKHAFKIHVFLFVCFTICHKCGGKGQTFSFAAFKFKFNFKKNQGYLKKM